MHQVDSNLVWLKPGQVAVRAGIAVSALHYYESLGLIRSRRTAGNRREYRRDTLRAIAFIRTAQRVGVSLDDIKQALDELPGDDLPTTRDWARIARKWHDDLTVRINELTALRDNFTHCIGCGCLSLKSCPYSNPDDILGLDGAGPRRFPPAPTRRDGSAEPGMRRPRTTHRAGSGPGLQRDDTAAPRRAT